MKLTRLDYYIFTHERYQKLSLKFLARFWMMTQSKSKENNDWQDLTIFISQVLKGFTKTSLLQNPMNLDHFLLRLGWELQTILISNNCYSRDDRQWCSAGVQFYNS